MAPYHLQLLFEDKWSKQEKYKMNKVGVEWKQQPKHQILDKFSRLYICFSNNRINTIHRWKRKTQQMCGSRKIINNGVVSPDSKQSSVISISQHIPKCFIPLKPQQPIFYLHHVSQEIILTFNSRHVSSSYHLCYRSYKHSPYFQKYSSSLRTYKAHYLFNFPWQKT